MGSKKKGSEIWQHYEQTESRKATCLYCRQVTSFSFGTTSNLYRHMRSKHSDIVNIPSAPKNYIEREDVEPEFEVVEVPYDADDTTEGGEPGEKNVRKTFVVEPIKDRAIQVVNLQQLIGTTVMDDGKVVKRRKKEKPSLPLFKFRAKEISTQTDNRVEIGTQTDNQPDVHSNAMANAKLDLLKVELQLKEAELIRQKRAALREDEEHELKMRILEKELQMKEKQLCISLEKSTTNTESFQEQTTEMPQLD